MQSPLCDWLVERFPDWLPPNVITLISFSFNVIPLFIMIALYGNEMAGPIPSWCAVMVGVSYFLFTTLDNCDGKQARRTGSSSPLGMLFDHGLDATSSIVVMYQIGRVHNCGGGFDLLLFIYLSSVSFYYFTLMEYYMGKMVLPMFSGPDDTSLGISIVCFITAYLGPAYWAQETSFLEFEHIQRKSLLLYALACFQLPFAACAVISKLCRISKTNETFAKRY